MSKLTSLALLAMLALSGFGSAQAAISGFSALLTGAAQNPQIETTGRGFGLVTHNDVLNNLSVEISFADLLGNTTVAHIHCCTDAPGNVGVAVGFDGFPSGVTQGTYGIPGAPILIDLTNTASFGSAFLSNNGGTAAGAEAALVAGLLANQAYINIHSSFAPSGEIRGFLQSVPTPASLPVVGLGLLGLIGVRRLRSRLQPRGI